MTLEAGKIYRVKHTSGIVDAKFIIATGNKTSYNKGARTRYRYVFLNLKTGKEITIKSTRKILGTKEV